MKLIVLLIFQILRHNDVITTLYRTYEFRFNIELRLYAEFQFIILSTG